MKPGRELMEAVRDGMKRKGTPFSTWCYEHGLYPQNARSALTGRWNGPKARQLRDRLIEAAGLDKEAA